MKTNIELELKCYWDTTKHDTFATSKTGGASCKNIHQAIVAKIMAQGMTNDAHEHL